MENWKQDRQKLGQACCQNDHFKTKPFVPQLLSLIIINFLLSKPNEFSNLKFHTNISNYRISIFSNVVPHDLKLQSSPYPYRLKTRRQVKYIKE